jgi:peptidoglycan/LPS O-acetylase OafA/YrhL
MKYNPQLDSMRALAALAIIAYHYVLFPAGWIGVQFFFVLSGFLISGIVLNGKKQYETQGMLFFFKDFYKRRMRRLFPLYFGYLGLLILLYFFIGKPEALNNEWLWLFTYTVNIRWLFNDYTFHMVYGHLWSLSLEWQFYLFWPFFLWKLSEKHFLKVMLCLIPVAMLIRIIEYMVCSHLTYLVGYNGSPEKQALAAYALPLSHLDAFVFGALLCDRRFRQFLCKPIVAYVSILAPMAAGLLLVVLIPAYPSVSLGWPINLPLAFQWIWGYSLLNLASAAIIVNLIKRKDAWLFSFTKLKLFQHLGKISYGIYVYHPIIIFITLGLSAKIHPFPGSKILELLMVMLLTCAAAHFSYELWEKRFLKKKKPIKTIIKPESEIVYN